MKTAAMLDQHPMQVGDLASTQAPMLTSVHYEVVDAGNRLVGDVKHATLEQAVQLRDALRAMGYLALSIAQVTERVVAQRQIARLG